MPCEGTANGLLRAERCSIRADADVRVRDANATQQPAPLITVGRTGPERANFNVTSDWIADRPSGMVVDGSLGLAKGCR
jgi:hypothetical protein